MGTIKHNNSIVVYQAMYMDGTFKFFRNMKRCSIGCNISRNSMSKSLKRDGYFQSNGWMITRKVID